MTRIPEKSAHPVDPGLLHVQALSRFRALRRWRRNSSPSTKTSNRRGFAPPSRQITSPVNSSVRRWKDRLHRRNYCGGPGRTTPASRSCARSRKEDDKTIKALYFQATDIAAAVGGYIYIENQYFQYEEWAQRLVKQCKARAALWRSAAAKSGKPMEDMPVLHVFVVAPVAGTRADGAEDIRHAGEPRTARGHERPAGINRKGNCGGLDEGRGRARQRHPEADRKTTGSGRLAVGGLDAAGQRRKPRPEGKNADALPGNLYSLEAASD